MNPWEEISLSDYENHMSLDSVKQLQAMNEMYSDSNRPDAETLEEMKSKLLCELDKLIK